MPTPAFLAVACKEADLPQSFSKAVERARFSDALSILEPDLAQPPFPSSAMAAIVHLVQQIKAIEERRGEIARTERSALAPEAQPYQDLIDRILYRMAGLTDTEAQGLEKRLQKML